MYNNYYPYIPVAHRQTDPTSASSRPKVYEESFFESLLNLNRGKVATFYFTFPNNTQWNARSVRGVVLTSGRDHIVIHDQQSNKRMMLLMANLDWVEFDGEIKYPSPPAYSSAVSQATAQTPTDEDPIIVPPPIVTG